MSTPQQTASEPLPWVVDEGHVIVPAFVSEGVQYYMMKDIFNSFAGRALDAMAIYEKWSLRSSPDFMRGWLSALENTINSNPIKITEVAEMLKIMRERLDFALPTEGLIWELAAVAFFDRNESPYRYDPEYAKDKIARWKKDMGLPDFFFRCPLRDIVSLPDLSEEGFKAYLTATAAVDQKHIETVLSRLSSQQQRAVSSLVLE